MDPFYELYKDAGHVPIEICMNGILSVICLVGICLNWSLVFVTIKSKSLRSPCNVLIAFYALSASLLLAGNTIKFFVFLLAFNYIPLRICYFIFILPTIGASFATRLQLFIGLERFVGVAWPVWYRQSCKHLLYKLLLALGSVNMVVSAYIYYSAAIQHWDKPVMCVFTDVTYLSEIASYTNTSALVVYFGEFICYALIWTIIWCRKSTVSQKNKKLMLCLSIIMAMNLIVYIWGTTFSHLVMPTLKLDMFAIEYVITPITNGMLCFAHSSITIILLVFSTEYLKAFRTIFVIGRHHQTRVAPIGNLMNNHNAIISTVAAN